MSEPQQEGQPEPTMEEILSSIRRIISDDDEPAGGAGKKPATAPVAAKPSMDDFDEEEAEILDEPEQQDQAQLGSAEVLELTQVVNEDGSVTDIDAIADDDMMFDEVTITPEPEPEPMPDPVMSAPVELLTGEPILGDVAARATAAALNQLVVEMPKFIGVGQGLTLEEITKELLRPMMKEWLDTHLPATVERLVQEEIARVSRLHR